MLLQGIAAGSAGQTTGGGAGCSVRAVAGTACSNEASNSLLVQAHAMHTYTNGRSTLHWQHYSVPAATDLARGVL